MARDIWIPKNYQHVSEWVSDETARRGQSSDEAWRHAFDTLGDYLAEDDAEDPEIAVFCAESGRAPQAVSAHEWRKPREERGKLTNSRIWRNLNVMGFGSGEWVCVAIRRTFRLPDATYGEIVPPASGSARLGDAQVDRFLKELDAEYKGRAAPSREEIQRRGKQRYGDKWTRNHSQRRNALDASTAAPIYPNLYGVKSGPRSRGQ